MDINASSGKLVHPFESSEKENFPELGEALRYVAPKRESGDLLGDITVDDIFGIDRSFIATEREKSHANKATYSARKNRQLRDHLVESREMLALRERTNDEFFANRQPTPAKANTVRVVLYDPVTGRFPEQERQAEEHKKRMFDDIAEQLREAKERQMAERGSQMLNEEDQEWRTRGDSLGYSSDEGEEREGFLAAQEDPEEGENHKLWEDNAGAFSGFPNHSAIMMSPLHGNVTPHRGKQARARSQLTSASKLNSANKSAFLQVPHTGAASVVPFMSPIPASNDYAYSVNFKSPGFTALDDMKSPHFSRAHMMSPIVEQSREDSRLSNGSTDTHSSNHSVTNVSIPASSTGLLSVDNTPVKHNEISQLTLSLSPSPERMSHMEASSMSNVVYPTPRRNTQSIAHPPPTSILKSSSRSRSRSSSESKHVTFSDESTTAHTSRLASNVSGNELVYPKVALDFSDESMELSSRLEEVTIDETVKDTSVSMQNMSELHSMADLSSFGGMDNTTLNHSTNTDVTLDKKNTDEVKSNPTTSIPAGIDYSVPHSPAVLSGFGLLSFCGTPSTRHSHFYRGKYLSRTLRKLAESGVITPHGHVRPASAADGYSRYRIHKQRVQAQDRPRSVGSSPLFHRRNGSLSRSFSVSRYPHVSFSTRSEYGNGSDTNLTRSFSDSSLSSSSVEEGLVKARHALQLTLSRD